MKKTNDKNSNFVKIMAGLLSGLMIFSVVATLLIVLAQ